MGEWRRLGEMGVGAGGASLLVDLFLVALISAFRQTQAVRNHDKKKSHIVASILSLCLKTRWSKFFSKIKNLDSVKVVGFKPKSSVKTVQSLSGQGLSLCWTVSETRCDDLWQRQPPQLIYYSASKRSRHDSCESIWDKHPPTLSHTSVHSTRTLSVY